MDIKSRAALVRELRFEAKQTRAEYERGLADRPGETNEQWVARQNAAIRRGDRYTRGDPARFGYPADRTVRPPGRRSRRSRMAANRLRMRQDRSARPD
jgi:hypothetical protein